MPLPRVARLQECGRHSGSDLVSRGRAPDYRSFPKYQRRVEVQTFSVDDLQVRFKIRKLNYKITNLLTTLDQFQQHASGTLRVDEHVAVAAGSRLDFVRHQANSIIL